MKNPLDEYIVEHDLSNEEMARMVGVSYTTIFHYRHGKIRPGVDIARRMHQVTGGKVPIGYWGYELINGKFVKAAKDPSASVKRGKFSFNLDKD